MTYLWTYQTPEGFSDMGMTSDGQSLTGLWFLGSRDERKHDGAGERRELPVFRQTSDWLDMYFAGGRPDFMPPWELRDLTPFRREVMEALLAIPYGETTTYGAIAAALAAKRGQGRMSARAVGGAVGWNPLCILIPCHRVVGSAGSLTGYGGGLRNKLALLRLEGADLTGFTVPTRGTAL